MSDVWPPAIFSEFLVRRKRLAHFVGIRYMKKRNDRFGIPNSLGPEKTKIVAHLKNLHQRDRCSAANIAGCKENCGSVGATCPDLQEKSGNKSDRERRRVCRS